MQSHTPLEHTIHSHEQQEYGNSHVQLNLLNGNAAMRPHAEIFCVFLYSKCKTSALFDSTTIQAEYLGAYEHRLSENYIQCQQTQNNFKHVDEREIDEKQILNSNKLQLPSLAPPTNTHKLYMYVCMLFIRRSGMTFVVQCTRTKSWRFLCMHACI